MATARAGKEAPLLSGGGLFGHIEALRSDPRALMTRFNRECGDVGRMEFLGVKALVANTPELVAECLVEKAAKFRKSRVVRTILHPLVGEGLFTSDGELWRRQRKLMAPLFSPARLLAYAPAMVECAARCVATWRDGAVVDVGRETTRITMAVAGKTLFDADTFDEADELGEALTTALRWAAEVAATVPLQLQIVAVDALDRLAARLPGRLGARATAAVPRLDRPILWPGERTRRLKRAIAVLDERVARMIAERRAEGLSRDDLLTRLLAARDEDGAGEVMSDRQLRDEVITLFVAGYETTATALAWAFYLLARHPAIYARLEAEADAFGRDGGAPAAPPTEERGATARSPAVDARDLPRLPLCTRVFQEALRLYPPVPVIERQAIEPVEIGGYRVPRSGFVTIFPWALHHREELWPEPSRFDPDRFADAAADARPRHAWIPFGAGPRVCIGNHFAMLEGPLVLASILRRVRLERVDDVEVVPDPRAATFRPLGAIRLRVRARVASRAA